MQDKLNKSQRRLIVFIIIVAVVGGVIAYLSAIQIQPSTEITGTSATRTFIPRTKPKGIEGIFNNQVDCEKVNGIWGRIGLSKSETCNLPTNDSGKICNDYNDCEGNCVSGAPNQGGKCSDHKIVVGCYQYFREGVGQFICTD